MLYLAADHAGFELKEKIKAHLVARGIDFQDMGAHQYNKDDDYPDFAYEAAKKVAESPEHNRAILICGSGAGVAIAANKMKGVYCAQVWTPALAKSAREHDGTNAIALASRYISEDVALQCVDAFLSSQSTNAERHRRRFEKIKKIEKI